MTIDRELLAAYIDGELDAVTAARITRDLTALPELAAEVAAQRRLRERLAAHYAPVLDEPIPASLTDAIEQSRKVVDLSEVRAGKAERRWISAPSVRYIGPALAACLVLFLIIPRGGSNDLVRTLDGQDFAAGTLDVALTGQLAANQDRMDDPRILLSFPAQDGSLCRGFSGSQLSGIACREQRGWRLRMERPGSPATSADYRQAGTADSDILAAAQEMAKDSPLDAEAERKAKANGWR